MFFVALYTASLSFTMNSLMCVIDNKRHLLPNNTNVLMLLQTIYSTKRTFHFSIIMLITLLDNLDKQTID